MLPKDNEVAEIHFPPATIYRSVSFYTASFVNRLCNRVSMIHVHIFILPLQTTFFFYRD